MEKSASPQPVAAKGKSSAVEVPANYGRSLPISEEEITAINVSVIEGKATVILSVLLFAAGRSKIAQHSV